MTKDQLSVVYYTSNFLETENPFFLENTKKQLVGAIGDLPLIVVSHKPVSKDFFTGYEGKYKNLVAGVDYTLWQPGRHHLNIYKQLMVGAMASETKYVAMAEDDILYSYDHFHSPEIDNWFSTGQDIFLYDMNKVSLFTWTKPPMFSFRSKRRVVNQLICPAQMLSDYMNERFERVRFLLESGKSLERILKIFGDPGRYDNQLGVRERRSEEYYCDTPSIVFTHPKAYGFLNHGRRKKLGDIKIIELFDWGRAEDILKLWGDQEKV